MSLDTNLNVTKPFLCRKESANDDRICWVKVLDELSGDFGELDTEVGSRAVTFNKGTRLRV